MAAAIVDRAETLAEELTALRAEMFGQRSLVNFLAFRWMLSRQQAELLAAALTLPHATHSALSQAMRGASLPHIRNVVLDIHQKLGFPVFELVHGMGYVIAPALRAQLVEGYEPAGAPSQTGRS